MSRKINLGNDPQPATSKRRRRKGVSEEERRERTLVKLRKTHGAYAELHMERREHHRKNQIAFDNAPGILHIFTDGSCIQRTGQGGWAAKLIWNGHAKTIYGGRAGVTNNIMEMTAILEGLKSRKRDVPTIVYSDSQYCIDSLTVWWRGWERRGWITSSGSPAKNVDLIKAITPLITDQVRFTWLKGHNGDENNEHVDEWAAEGRRLFGNLVDGGRNEQAQPASATQNEGSPSREGGLPDTGATPEGDQQEPAAPARPAGRPGKATFQSR